MKDSLAELFIVSKVTIREGEEDIRISKAPGEKCVRCWCFSETVGKNHEHPELCERCAAVISE